MRACTRSKMSLNIGWQSREQFEQMSDKFFQSNAHFHFSRFPLFTLDGIGIFKLLFRYCLLSNLLYKYFHPKSIFLHFWNNYFVLELSF